eukprot:g35497.t1
MGVVSDGVSSVVGSIRSDVNSIGKRNVNCIGGSDDVGGVSGRGQVNRMVSDLPTTASNFIMPKIHTPVSTSFPKSTNLTAPADPLSACFCPTELPSTYVDSVFSAWSRNSPPRDFRSLYACIPHVDGLKATLFFLFHRPNQSPSTDTLICLTELVLTLNKFSFNSSHFLQTKGVATGSRMGPSYACIFVGYVEQSLSRCYTGTIPHLLLRYIDDCIGAASCYHQELEQFINFPNTFHPNLKFTLDHLRYLPPLPGPPFL